MHFHPMEKQQRINAALKIQNCVVRLKREKKKAGRGGSPDCDAAMTVELLTLP